MNGIRLKLRVFRRTRRCQRILDRQKLDQLQIREQRLILILRRKAASFRSSPEEQRSL